LKIFIFYNTVMLSYRHCLGYNTASCHCRVISP